MDLLQTQKNELVVEIEIAGYAVSHFVFYMSRSLRGGVGLVPRVDYQPRRKFYFQFEAFGATRYCYFSPGLESVRDFVEVHGWSDQRNWFGVWLGFLRREVEAPDFWSLGTAGLLGGARRDQDNSKFTTAEVERIDKSLSSLSEEIRTLAATTAAHNQAIDSNFAYLREAANRVGRFDWKNLLVSQLINLATLLGTNQEAAQAIARAAGLAFSWLTGHPLLPPA